MLKNFKPGDKVRWVDQPWSGIVQEISGARAHVLLGDGFTEWVQINKLIRDGELDISFDEAHTLEKNKEQHLELRPIKSEEIDLHIENLFVHWRSIPASTILERQIQAFNEEFQTCLHKKIDELIVIHGKGSGVLKRNIKEILSSRTNISIEEMNHGKYKQAAIKIFFHSPL
jgi:hypothetical protein